MPISKMQFAAAFLILAALASGTSLKVAKHHHHIHRHKAAFLAARNATDDIDNASAAEDLKEDADDEGLKEEEDGQDEAPETADLDTNDEEEDEQDGDEDGEAEEPQNTTTTSAASSTEAAVVGYQTPVVVVVTLKNLDYDVVASDQSTHAAVEAVIRQSLASGAGEDLIDSDDVSLVSWPGSVRARAVLKPRSGVASEDILGKLQSDEELNSLIADKVGGIEGIQRAVSGVVTCDVDVLVAENSSSVSRVMSRAKGHKHLGRVYELEKRAAEAREALSAFTGEAAKIDEKITNLQDDAAFTRMVDERVKKVDKELQAPVFAETLGDMWKEMRMFGAPCLLKYLRKEKADIKTQMLQAEQNATEAEEELHNARDNVTDAWYGGKTKSSSFVQTPNLAALVLSVLSLVIAVSMP